MRTNLASTTKAYPLSFTSVEPRLDRVISRRWREIRPFALAEVRRWRGPAATIEAFENQHRMLVLRLRRAGVEMRVIRRNSLDDPRLSSDERELLLEPYLKGKP